ncbi:MAG: hypothetical protein U0169_20370 [Polyangiaceae bacterium]
MTTEHRSPPSPTTTEVRRRRAWSPVASVALAASVSVAIAASGCGKPDSGSGFGGKAPTKPATTAIGGGNDGPGDDVTGTDPNGTDIGGDFGDTPDATAPTGDAGSLFSDAAPDVDPDALCTAEDAGPPKFPQRCMPATTNECDGTTDIGLTQVGVGGALLNGRNGNGFDDDCDGLVDEGCSCTASGTTKDCYLMPASQADPATGKPAGWCTDNSKGSLDCAGNEFPKWSGTCRGAQPPYEDDVCAPGDFDCDGVTANARSHSCACQVDPVTCPTTPIVVAPYPNPTNIPAIDGSQWIVPAERGNAQNWTWTVLGGDCDNVLPFPTFAVYNQANSKATGARIGSRSLVAFDANQTPARYVTDPTSGLVGIRATTGSALNSGVVYPAFGLSGDYVVQGEWDLGGKHYVCTQKVEVRAPGIRAELCWDTVGGGLLSTEGGNDIDLHFARLQGVTCAKQGWDSTCSSGGAQQDCYWNSSSKCTSGSTNANWGYANAASSSICTGWSSPRSASTTCTNPRLDKDNVSCTRTESDPTSLSFCGPENINLDAPNDQDRFVIGVNHFANHGGTSEAKPHVNVYCNGKRVLSAGYNPATNQRDFPKLLNGGTDTSGDYWTVGIVKANVQNGALDTCDVETVASHTADATRDGVAAAPATGNGICVDSHTGSPAPAGKFKYANHEFVENGALQTGTNGIPNTAADFCKH